MKNDVVDVLIYIFERFQDQDYVVIEEATKLVEELTQVGFSEVDIDSALDWLDGLMDVRKKADEESFNYQDIKLSNRIFNEKEQLIFSREAQGFIYKLEQVGVLDSVTREWVIERVMALDVEQVDLEQLKWISMMVLFNLPGRESACAWFENVDEHIH